MALLTSANTVKTLAYTNNGVNFKDFWYAYAKSKQTVRGIHNAGANTDLIMFDATAPGLPVIEMENYDNFGSVGSVGGVPTILEPRHRAWNADLSGDWCSEDFLKEMIAWHFNADPDTETEAVEGPVTLIAKNIISQLRTTCFYAHGKVWVAHGGLHNLKVEGDAENNAGIKWSATVKNIMVDLDEIINSGGVWFATPALVYPGSQNDEGRTGLTWHDIHLNVTGGVDDVSVKRFTLDIGREGGFVHSAGRGRWPFVTGGTYQDPSGGKYVVGDCIVSGGNVWRLKTALNAVSGATVFPGSPTANQTVTGTEGTWQYIANDVTRYQPNDIFLEDAEQMITLQALVMESDLSEYVIDALKGGTRDIEFWIGGIKFELGASMITAIEPTNFKSAAAMNITFKATNKASRAPLEIYNVRPAV